MMNLLRVFLGKLLEQYLSVSQNIVTKVLRKKKKKHFDAGSLIMRKTNISGLMLLRFSDE